MGALDSVVTEVGNRFGMSSANAGSLLSSLLTCITQQEGGLSGLLDKFRSAGMASSVSSWLGGEAKPVTVEGVESALGPATISSIASRAGLSFTTAASAIAFMLPRLVQRLAPGGVIPTHLSSDFTSYITGPTAALASGTRQAFQVADAATQKTGLRKFLWPLLALLGILLLALWLRSRPETTFNAAEQVRLAGQKAAAALAALTPGSTSQDLVKALNLNIINFSTGSAQIPVENQDFLNRAATVMKSAQAAQVIEIGGHTDNTGDEAANLQLSQQRADGVRDYLVQQGVNASMLVAKGYGSSRPVAANDTEEGKFRNRRIEFSVVQ